MSRRASTRVVGIGASAGGLSAFEAFFAALPPQAAGVAFVVVQHLAPDHESLLSGLLRRSTTLQVLDAVDRMKIAPGCVYVITPGHRLELDGERLRLSPTPTPTDGVPLPIDHFFTSLATQRGAAATCIVLSGTGFDGRAGAEAIKRAGGVVLVQSPESATWPDMPRHVIEAGIADAVLAPADLARRSTAGGSGASPAATEASDERTLIEKILHLVLERTGHDFTAYKPSTVRRRIDRRIAIHQLPSLAEYHNLVTSSTTEVEELFRDLLIGVTNFFRDPDAFVALERSIAERLADDLPSGATIRAWSVGCATGEEPYSVAMVLVEQLQQLRRNAKVQIFATDIDRSAIAAARAGFFSPSIADDVGPERLARFFTADADRAGFRVDKALRDLVVYSEHDVTRDPPFSRMDLIVCRNLLIYLGRDAQRRLMTLFHYSLNPGGLLLLGSSETVGEHGASFAAVDRTWKLYRRVEAGTHRSVPEGLAQLTANVTSSHQRVSTVDPAGAPTAWRDVMERALLDLLAPVAALVDGRGDVLYLHGRSGAFLEPQPGVTGVGNIITMAREGLGHVIASALHHAQRSGEVVRRLGAPVTRDDVAVRVDVTVSPVDKRWTEGVSDARFVGPVFVVVLATDDRPVAASAAPAADAAPGTDVAPSAARPGSAGVDHAARVVELERELRMQQDYLQTTLEELETSNEELRSSSEEMQSVNEELQSTNEELETSKEELQSVNEELATVNAELLAKVADLSRANNDMNNLFAGSGIATVFVDMDLRVMRFTPPVTRFVSLIAADAGRPIDDIRTRLVGYDHLALDIAHVLSTLEPKSVNVLGGDGRRCTLRITPYRTQENVVEGAVVTFLDHDEPAEAGRDEGAR